MQWGKPLIAVEVEINANSNENNDNVELNSFEINAIAQQQANFAIA